MKQMLKLALLCTVAVLSLHAKKDKDSVLNVINQKVSQINTNVSQIRKDLECTGTAIKAPKLTIVLVGEHWPYNYLQYLKPYLTRGLKFLMDNGINYINATYPEGLPASSPGHLTLSSGALGQTHGMIDNNWFQNGVRFGAADDQTSFPAQVYVASGSQAGQLYPLSQTSIYTNGLGKSGRSIRSDTIADQIEFYSTPQSVKHFFWVSLMDTSNPQAFMPSGQLGKALMFDPVAGGFTSSQAYYPNGLPQWVLDWNQAQGFPQMTSWVQNLTYPVSSPAYNLPFINNYTYASQPTIIDHATGLGIPQPMVVCPSPIGCATTPFKLGNYINSPDALSKLFNFLEVLLDNNLAGTDELVIFVNVLTAHQDTIYGQRSLETVDMVYHLDQAIGDFITQVYNRVDPSQVLFTFLTDEGSDGELQLWNVAGDTNAGPTNATTVQNAINAAVLTATGIAGIVPANGVGVTNVWMGPAYFTQPAATQAIILSTVKSTMLTFTAVKRVWTFDELQNAPFEDEEEERFLKLDNYPGRSGQIRYSTLPLNSVSGITGGNRTLWEGCYHVPLIIYQQGQFQNKTIYEPVRVNQLPITLSQVLGVPRTSGAPRIWGPLPGIFCDPTR